MALWCHVKFLLDNEVVNVPTSFFEVIVNGVVSDPTDLEVNSVYWVFWSASKEETPSSVVMKGNTPLKIDDLSDKEREGRRKSNGGPLQDYYKAMLLDLRSEEDSFCDVTSVSTSSSKRVHIPTTKLTESNILKNMSSSSSDSKNKSTSKERSEKQRAASAAQEASKSNILSLLQSCGSSAASKKKSDISDDDSTVSDFRSSDDSDNNDQDGDKDDSEYWKEKCKTIMKKLEQGKKKNKLKKKKKKKKSKKSEVKLPTKHSKLASPSGGLVPGHVKSNESIKTTPVSKNVNLEAGSPRTHKISETNVQNATMTAHEQSVAEGNMTTDKNEASGGEQLSPTSSFVKSGSPSNEKYSMKLSSTPDTGAKLLEQKDSMKRTIMDIEENRDDAVNFVKKKRPKSGKDGDSLFVMNEALNTWGHQAVAIRSPTGVAQSRRGSKDTKGYPKMTPEKVKKIRDKLKERILQEEPNIFQEDLQSRSSKLSYYLGQRVSSSRRALRDKGIAIPTAEEVWATKEADPSSDGTAAYNTKTVASIAVASVDKED